MEGHGKQLRVLGFNASQRAAFARLVMTFGLGNGKWTHLILRKGSLRFKSYCELVAYGNLFIAHLVEPKNLSSNPNTYADGIPRESFFKRKDILARIARIHLIENKMRSTGGINDFIIQDAGWTDLQHWWQDDQSPWKQKHDYLLLQAVLRYGYSRWKDIIK